MSYDRRGSRRTGAGIRLRTLCALAVLLAAVVFNLQWIWGVLFLFWSAQSLFAGVTFLVEPVYRDENPQALLGHSGVVVGPEPGAHRHRTGGAGRLDGLSERPRGLHRRQGRLHRGHHRRGDWTSRVFCPLQLSVRLKECFTDLVLELR